MGSGDEAGFTFNELLVAMGFVTVAVMGYSLSSVQLFRQQLVASHSTIALQLAQDKMEELHGQRPLLDVDNCPDGGDHGLSGGSAAGGIFDRCWKVQESALGSDLKQIDVVVSWRDREIRNVALATLIYTGN